jgi:hypothetical protein
LVVKSHHAIDAFQIVPIATNNTLHFFTSLAFPSNNHFSVKVFFVLKIYFSSHISAGHAHKTFHQKNPELLVLGVFQVIISQISHSFFVGYIFIT